jgi:hypothetical protein
MTTEPPKTRVKIGLSYVPREIDVDVDDAEGFITEFDRAMAEGTKVWWVTDREGHRHGIVVDKVAYVDVEPEKDRKVGFGA